MFRTFIVVILFIKYCLSVNLQTCTDAPKNQICKVKQDYDKSKVEGTLGQDHLQK